MTTHMGWKTMLFSRRKLIGGSAGGFVAAICQKTASSQPLPTISRNTKLVVTGYYRTPAFLIAQSKGYFAKEGLEVEFHLVGLAPEHNRGLAEGRWPITLSSADTMLARTSQDNTDFLIFLQPEQGLDVQLVARPGIKKLSDLRGKVFAADPVDSNYDLVRNKVMLSNGVRENEYLIDILGNSRARAEAFAAGKVDAAMLQGQFSENALAKGGMLLADGADYIPNWPIMCGWGLRKWIESNRGTVVRFSRALAMASDWLLAPENHEETIQLMMKEERLSRPRAEKNYSFVLPAAEPQPKSLLENLELRIELGYYKPPHKPIEAFYDGTYWGQATGRAVPAPAGFPRNAIR